ncbi:tetraacyldisaccharide 4'-kinase [Flagellimonas eckloniae]|uniref:Tetraacyldisaccharide 4'-kinase n=1 Tax=Flagellimonas eckloniae TaxID=346185 RepID=A0A0Q1DL96_9FLAO|nr:tetraacyldisaccharide 4'-kinase [Allomuricauda eckloniae]KQC29712.1 tetraacyldisaccharide 4'-kinase [Allomuricauda eckloniae]
MQQLLRKIAFPFSLIYALVIFLRNYLYNIGFYRSLSYPTVTICVGNLSVGGTGKTPMIEYLIRLLDSHSIAVLSRGYKRKSKGFLIAESKSSVEDIGDEPFQIHKKFPKITVAVDADRRNGITQLENLVKPDVVLLDDAFQHRKVKPTYSILLTAYGNLYIDDWYLPTGNLRDSKSEAKRAHMVIVTKCPKLLSEDERTAISKKLKLLSGQKLLFSSLAYNEVVKNGSKDEIALLSLKEKKVVLVTGIASPKPLVSHLFDIGLQVTHFEYADHHYFTEKEIQEFSGFEIILTTEKDFVRLSGKVDNLYYLEVAHQFSKEDEMILQKAILDLI